MGVVELEGWTLTKQFGCADDGCVMWWYVVTMFWRGAAREERGPSERRQRRPMGLSVGDLSNLRRVSEVV